MNSRTRTTAGFREAKYQVRTLLSNRSAPVVNGVLNDGRIPPSGDFAEDTKVPRERQRQCECISISGGGNKPVDRKLRAL